VVELLVIGQPEETHEHEPALDHYGHGGGDQVRPIAGDHEVHLIDIEQLRIDAGDGRWLALIVVVDELHRSPEQAARFVDVITPELHG
jgi:hypothetical protein